MEIAKGQYKDIILSIDEENIKCADCGKENPIKVSVNNGIILCEGCALQHLELGPNVSYIRDLSGEFDEYLLNYFTLGGNSKFKKFLKEENVDTSLPINKKYLTRACEFYRINLKRKVQGVDLLTKKYENPNEIVENMENNFPEFEDYVIKNQKQNKNQKLGQAKKLIGNIGSGLFSFGKKVYSGVKQGANFVAVKAQPATNKIKKGAVYMGHQVGGVYSNIKNKITSLNKGQQKEKEEEKDENENKNDNNEKKEENEIKEEEKKEEVKNEENNGAGILLNNPSINNEPSQEQKAEQ
mgnify:CR=1 FL=1|jgi:hypothetical protein